MKRSAERTQARQLNLAKRAILTKEIDRRKDARSTLAQECKEITEQEKLALIARIERCNDSYGVKRLLVQTPLNVGAYWHLSEEEKQQVHKYNVLCSEYSEIIDQLREQKAQTAMLLVKNGNLNPNNLM